MKKHSLTKANAAFQEKNYSLALDLYRSFASKNPALAKAIEANITISEKRVQLAQNKTASSNAERMIVYTCNFGHYESVKEPLHVEPGIQYLLFTDNKDLTSKHWKIVLLNETLSDPRRTSRLPKLLPHKYLPDHDISVYIDSSLELKATHIRRMIDECMEGQDIALYRHYRRNCVYDEIRFVMSDADRVVADKEKCIAALKKYEAINYPVNNGLFENAFIFRRNTASIRKLCDLWWREYETGADRDQFTFMYALWQAGIKVNAIKHGEQFRINPYVNFYKHRYKRYQREHLHLAKLNIALITFGFWPQQAGMEMMIHNLATHLMKLNKSVSLFAPKPKQKYKEIDHHYNLIRFQDNADLMKSFERLHMQDPFDLIYVQGAHEPCAIALTLREKHHVPVVLRTHGEDIQEDSQLGYGYALDGELKKLIENNMRAVDYNVTIGPHIFDKVNKLLGNNSVELIFNGIDTQFFYPKPTAFLKEKLGLAHNAKILLTVGRNVKKKSFHLALEVLSHVKKLIKNVVLVHVGKKGNGVNLKEYAARLNLEDHFFELGATDYFTLPDIYASADLFIFTSKIETFGNVTVEAMASGLPCIEFDYVVNREKISHGDSGYVIPYGDIHQFAGKVVELLNNKKQRQQFSQAARRKVCEQFSWEMIARQYQKRFLTVSQDYYSHHYLHKLDTDVDRLKLNLTEWGNPTLALQKLHALMGASVPQHFRNEAAWVLACWYCDQGTPEAYRKALKCLDDFEKNAIPAKDERLAAAIILKAEALISLNESAKAQTVLQVALDANPTADLFLAMANLQTEPDKKLICINQALNSTRTDRLEINARETSNFFEHLRCSASLQATRPSEEQPLVSVIVPAYNSAATIHIALNSLTEQTWRNLEIIVVDDCSTDNTRAVVTEYASNKDIAIKLIENNINSGPYVCRNLGMAASKGEFVTVHDADDWSHPRKIEYQTEVLLSNPMVVSSASLWARVTDDWIFKRRGNPGHYVQLNLSSILFRKKAVLEKIGYWDSVRFGADGEFNHRLWKAFGKNAKKTIQRILSFARLDAQSLTGNNETGYPGYAFGSRKQYRLMYQDHHDTAPSLKYDFPLQKRHFPAPAIMQPDYQHRYQQFDVVYVTDFRLQENADFFLAHVEKIKVWADNIALIQAYNPTIQCKNEKFDKRIMKLLESGEAKFSVYGEKIQALSLYAFDPGLAFGEHKFVPRLKTIYNKFLFESLEDCDSNKAQQVEKLLGKRFNVRCHIDSRAGDGLNLYCPYDWNPIDVVSTANGSGYVYDGGDVAVIMPTIDLALGLATAKNLLMRAGMDVKIIVAEDTLRQGFIKTFNQFAAKVDAKYVVYVAQDVIPGRQWLKIAYEALESSGKGLLAFNDGKWFGRIASYGMVRKSWIKQYYRSHVLCPEYRSHAADNEITVLARVTDQFVFAPTAVLMENDVGKDYGGSNVLDSALFRLRFNHQFNLKISGQKLEALRDEYKVPS